MNIDDTFILLGVIYAAHGVRGCVKIKTFTHDPSDIAAYGPLTDGSESLKVSVMSVIKNGCVIAKVSGIDDRCSAEALKNKKLYVSSSCLPKLKNDEFYKDELIGLSVKLPDDTIFGIVTEVFNFGSGDIVEISTPQGKKEMFSFTSNIFPSIDMKTREMTIVPPEIVGVYK